LKIIYKDIYGIEVSASLISKVTDKIFPYITEWQSRPLDEVYPIVYLDAIHFKVRKDNKVVNKAAYTVLGINLSGVKEILGIWIGENESASFWLGVCNDLRNRGVDDILIACKDGLSGFSEAINTVFPKTDIQLCVIHQIRNSMKYVSYKEQKAVMADLKQVYKALTIEEAELAFENFKEKWGKKHPIIIRSWEQNWLELTTYFNYPQEIRRLIYTTIYLATMEVSKKWTMPIKDWSSCISQFAIQFGDRFPMNLIV